MNDGVKEAITYTLISLLLILVWLCVIYTASQLVNEKESIKMVNGTTYLPEPEEYDIVEEIDDKTVSVINEDKVPGYMREGTFVPRELVLELFEHALKKSIEEHNSTLYGIDIFAKSDKTPRSFYYRYDYSTPSLYETIDVMLDDLKEVE